MITQRDSGPVKRSGPRGEEHDVDSTRQTRHTYTQTHTHTHTHDRTQCIGREEWEIRGDIARDREVEGGRERERERTQVPLRLTRVVAERGARRDGRVEPRDLEVGVRRRRPVALHVDEPRRRRGLAHAERGA